MEWIAAGKPKITRTLDLAALTPDKIATLPTDALIATVRELARRRVAHEIAAMILG